MSEHCQWVEDDTGFRFFLPGCMGAAVNGLEGCTCDRGALSIDEALSNAGFYEAENRRLRVKIAELEAKIRRLSDGTRS